MAPLRVTGCTGSVLSHRPKSEVCRGPGWSSSSRGGRRILTLLIPPCPPLHRFKQAGPRLRFSTSSSPSKHSGALPRPSAQPQPPNMEALHRRGMKAAMALARSSGATPAARMAVPQQRQFFQAAYNLAKKVTPKISATEAAALDAGTVGFDRDLFAGNPSLAGLKKKYDLTVRLWSKGGREGGREGGRGMCFEKKGQTRLATIAVAFSLFVFPCASHTCQLKTSHEARERQKNTHSSFSLVAFVFTPSNRSPPRSVPFWRTRWRSSARCLASMKCTRTRYVGPSLPPSLSPSLLPFSSPALFLPIENEKNKPTLSILPFLPPCLPPSLPFSL